MQFIQNNEWYKAVRITGPSHNLLGLTFGEDADDQVEVQPLPVKEGQAKRISAEDVRQHVLDGVIEANQGLGTSYRVRKIQFVPTDTPPPDVYRALAKSIVERIARKEAFVQSK